VSDKIKQAARHIQDETGMRYQAALSIVRGDLRPIPQAADCAIKRAFETMPEKLRVRMPALGEAAQGKPAPKPCRCARCGP